MYLLFTDTSRGALINPRTIRRLQSPRPLSVFLARLLLYRSYGNTTEPPIDEAIMETSHILIMVLTMVIYYLLVLFDEI
jgi:hypothetical protein